MAIYYKNKKNDRAFIYTVIEKWRNDCLIKDGSLLWDGESIRTKDNIDRFKAIFIDNPDESDESFDKKLEKQLADETENVYKFTIELLFMYYIYPYPGSISFETKIKKLKMIASWKGIELDTTQTTFNALSQGIGATGTFYNTSKYYEISYLLYFAENIKSISIELRNETLSHSQELKQLAEETRKKVGKNVQSQNILLHLLLPEKFERIASWGHKKKIEKSFSYLIKDSSTNDLDERLYDIREQLHQQYPVEKFDFYEVPEVHEKWDKAKNAREKDKPKEASKSDGEKTESNIPSLDFSVDSFQSDLIFENADVLHDQITTALRNGKHIILIGPPGTGKSKLARAICKMYKVQSKMVTASSNWSTFETIGGYRPDQHGNLYFNEGIFLECIENKKTLVTKSEWLIIDEINRADIDKAFGTLFSVLTGDEVTLPFQSKTGESIVIKPQGDRNYFEPNDYTYIIPNDWRIIATMNTDDKASLYEMSYAFMRRFAFIPVGIPKEITRDLVDSYLEAWNMETYPNPDILVSIWKIINNYHKIGPAIIQDIAKHTQDNDDFTSAIILYVLPQFEGLSKNRIKQFITRIVTETVAVIVRPLIDDFINDFFDAGGLE